MSYFVVQKITKQPAEDEKIVFSFDEAVQIFVKEFPQEFESLQTILSAYDSSDPNLKEYRLKCMALASMAFNKGKSKAYAAAANLAYYLRKY